MGEIRLNKIIRTYNIGLQSLVDFLNSQGVEVDANPNAKISDEHLGAIYHVCEQSGVKALAFIKNLFRKCPLLVRSHNCRVGL